MQIIDSNGKVIKITNLHAAIELTKLLIEYFEELQKAYWRDVLSKLQGLALLN